jgi:hypothetical protein
VIAGPQIRAARGFLAWDRRDLARKAIVTIYTVERLKTGADISGTAMANGLAAIKAALEAEGIEFTDDKGVLGVRHPTIGAAIATGPDVEAAMLRTQASVYTHASEGGHG